MRLFMRQALAVARAEWRVTWRGLGLRLALALLALPFLVLTLFSVQRVHYWEDDGGLATLTFAASFAGLLAAFVVVPSYRREGTARMAELIWVRPLGGAAHLAGKTVAAALVAVTLLIELTAVVAAYQTAIGGRAGAPLLAGAVLAAAPALLLTSVLSVACGALLRHPLWGYGVVLVFCLLSGVALEQSMTFLWNPWALSLSDNPALAGAATLLFARRERRALAPRGQRRAALAVLIGGLVVCGAAVPSFRAAAAAVTLSGPVTTPRAVPLTVADYRLDLRLDPADGALRGAAGFTVRGDGHTPVTTLPLYLNDGLRVGAATVDGHAAAVRGGTLFSTLDLSPVLAPGQRATVRVTYAGRYKMLRFRYAPSRMAGGRFADDWYEKHPCFIGDGMALLYGDGDWYPTPWTALATTVSRPALGWRALSLRLPYSATAVASTPDERRAGADRVFSWALSGRLPGAVLAALPATYARVTVPDGAVYAPAMGAATPRARFGPYAPALRDVTSFFGGRPRSVSVVVAPTNAGVYVSQVEVGDGLVIVPSGALDQNAAEARISPLAPPAPYRAALDDVAAAWWVSRMSYTGQDLTLPTTYWGRYDLPAVFPSVGDSPGLRAPTALSGYTGAAAAELRLGTGFYRRELALRRRASALVRLDTTWKQETLLDNGQGPLSGDLYALGLAGRLTAGDDTPLMDDLRRAIGPVRLRRELIALSADGLTLSNDDQTAVCALTHRTGQPLATWQRRYERGGASAYGASGDCR